MKTVVNTNRSVNQIHLNNDCFNNYNRSDNMVVYILITSSRLEEEEKEKIRNKKKRLKSQLDELENYDFSEKLTANNAIIGLDKSKETMALSNNLYRPKIFPFSTIHSCEIIINGNTVSKRTSIIGRSILGGVIGGGAGAVIGGLSGKGKTYEEISSIKFKILFMNTKQNAFYVVFLNARTLTYGLKDTIKTNDKHYGDIVKKAKRKAKFWKDKIDVIITSQEKKHLSDNSNTDISIVEKLKKITELKNNGTLNEKEFGDIKTKLIKNHNN